jgi:hypothetical protein
MMFGGSPTKVAAPPIFAIKLHSKEMELGLLLVLANNYCRQDRKINSCYIIKNCTS